MAMVEVSVVPLGTGTPSVSEYVAGAKRVLTTIKIDEREDKPLTIRGKVESVEIKLLH